MCVVLKTKKVYYPTFGLGLLGDLENVSEMVAETSETSKDQKSESATVEKQHVHVHV